jgi:hypothetical protein
MFFTAETISRAVVELHDSAGHMLKIWFALKRMGLRPGGEPLNIDTKNSTPALIDLFGFGALDESFFVPFAKTSRFKTMESDASRSIIQTNIRRWATSDSVVTCDPTGFLKIQEDADEQLLVSCSNFYPQGLGHGSNGFASDDEVVAIPWLPWTVWYCRQRDLGDEKTALEVAQQIVIDELSLDRVEREILFVGQPFDAQLQESKITNSELVAICNPDAEYARKETEFASKKPTFTEHSRRVRAMIPGLGSPPWLRPNPEKDLKTAIDGGSVAVLLYGPPRTGKTRAVDVLIQRSNPTRETIQLHDGWTYDRLVQGILPTSDGGWDWQDGPLLRALRAGKKFIVLEEANRTSLVQCLGEVFSLLERQYRGSEYSVTLRDGARLSIDEDVVFVLTANTLDKSTEDLDDALLGRIHAVYCPPSSESLLSILESKRISVEKRELVVEIFNQIQEFYPLGHGYFADVDEDASSSSIKFLYKTRIRPVVDNFLGDQRASDLSTIDQAVDSKLTW